MGKRMARPTMKSPKSSPFRARGAIGAPANAWFVGPHVSTLQTAGQDLRV